VARSAPHYGRHLTISQVEHLARECGYPSNPSKHRSYAERAREPYWLAVLFLAYTGVRFGEMAALRAGRVDLERADCNANLLGAHPMPSAWRSQTPTETSTTRGFAPTSPSSSTARSPNTSPTALSPPHFWVLLGAGR
jgi:integrase